MKILLLDSHSLFRSGLVHLFNSQPDFDVIGEADKVSEAFLILKDKQPDLILMDSRLTDGSGIEAIPKILQISPNIHIVFLTSYQSDELVFTAIQHGAKGFLPKDITAPALLTALRGVERDELAMPRTILSRFVNEIKPFVNTQHGIEKNCKDLTLTKRETEILMALGKGDSNKELAERYSISVNTAKVHVHNVLRKLKLQNRYEAAAYAKRIGLLAED